MENSSQKRTKIGSFISSAISAVGAGGSGTSAVCQTVCSTSSSVLPLLGFSLATTPFAFLENYHTIFWWIAFVFFIFVLITTRKTALRPLEKSFLFFNGGLLLIGLPYRRAIQLVNDAVLLMGIIVIIYGIYALIRSKKIIIRFSE